MKTTTPKIQPLRGGERMVILDFLRGLAIFGILVVNMNWYNAPLFAQMGDLIPWQDAPNKLALLFIKIFFESKFYPLFSVLFGLGFYYFMQKATEDTAPVMFRYRMRLFYLLLFGILHVVFFWHGDILIIYALFGFVMTWFYRKSDKTLIVWIALFVALPALMIVAMVALLQFAMQMPEAAEGIAQGFAGQERYAREFVARAYEVYATGSFTEIMRVRLTDYMHALNGIIFAFPNVMSLFLIGLLMGRKQVFRSLPHALGVLRKIFFWCLPLAIVFNGMYVYASTTGSFIQPDWNMAAMVVGGLIGGPAQMFIYVYLAAWLYHRGVFGRLAGAVESVGRMAFTNYLAHTIIVTTIFYSYGLGLYGQVNYWQGILLAVPIYILQLIWSPYWLKRFRFGPFEWLWRTATYGKKQPFRRD